MKMAALSLTASDLTRYKRQIVFPGFGEEGQKRLKESHVLVVGLGGIGCPASIYLACAGVGHITIVDSDFIEPSNLNRQILHWDSDVGKKKVLSAARKLRKLNSSIEVTPVFERITERNAGYTIAGCQAVIDATDNFETRLVLNATCVKERIPLIHGGVRGFLGEVTTIIPGKTPCLACIFPRAPNRRGFPVFGVSPGLVAMLQVTEAIKLLSQFGELLLGKMLYVNGETMGFYMRELTRRPECEVCREVG